jgi:lipoprotein signal peptidase
LQAGGHRFEPDTLHSVIQSPATSHRRAGRSPFRPPVLPRYARAPVLTGATLLIAEAVLDALARRYLYPRAVPHHLIVDALTLEYLRNPGGIFGLGAESGWLTPWLPLLQGLVLVPLARLWRRTRADDARMLVLIALTAAGVLGNLLSRLRDGFVVDYVVLSAAGRVHVAGNLADLAIIAGATESATTSGASAFRTA